MDNNAGPINIVVSPSIICFFLFFLKQDLMESNLIGHN